ncbi:expressed unknown protein [Ectocarpus siliculosus]|uniref:Uncharacterized protein n=1 Tax=Ectocarpus siliculosus TaxID=2880 RepID=D7FH32_ECTSI|nr:expressed unknown protein [Ectocarpus siliculosus]|eukprot:CBJ28410.1 expressed unknown protein [Ectocarpus siliculosus]
MSGGGGDTFGGGGLFSGPAAATENGKGGGDANNMNRPVYPGRTPPPYDADDGDSSAVTQGPPTYAASAAPPAPPAYEVPPPRMTAARGTAIGAPAAEVDEAYFFTDVYPFTAAQFDRERENLLGHHTGLDPKMAQIDPSSRKMLQMTSGVAADLEKWDIECARKHLDAIKDSVTTHDDLHQFTFMKGEKVVNALDLAGLEEAPGVFDEVTQRCRVVFTNKKRLIFTQVLQVFVQQKLTTSYQTSTCTFNDILDFLCCPTGGTMYSEKNIHGVTQTLGDHDPGDCMSRWDKTRHMRHALVIRYVDCASNSVKETTAMAHPSIPASQLYEMARSIEANITIRTADWMKCKSLPTALNAGSFNNSPPSPPLFKRKSYKGLMFLLLIVSLIFFAVNPTAAVFMFLSVLAALFGAYSGSKTQQKRVRNAGSWILNAASKRTLGSNGAGAGVYALSFFLGLQNTDGSSSQSASSYPY